MQPEAYVHVPTLFGRLGAWVTRRRRLLLRSLIADVLANRKTTPKPISDRIGPTVTLAFGFASLSFVAYLGAAVAVPQELNDAFQAVSTAMQCSFFCLAILLLVEHERRTHDNLSPATLKFFTRIAQATMVVGVIMAAHVVVVVGIRFTDDDFKDDPQVVVAQTRSNCLQRRLKEVESVAEDIKEADKSVAQCGHQFDAHVFTINLAQEKGELSEGKAKDLRKAAWRLCLPYIDAYDDHKLRMELAFARSCEQDFSSPLD